MDGGAPWRHTYGDNLTYTDWKRDNFFRALQLLVGDSKGKRVAFEFDVLTVEQMNKLNTFLPNIEMVSFIIAMQ